MPGLIPLGMVHLAISLIAVAAGLAALLRHGEIAWWSRAGKAFIGFTLLSCLTGLAIFQHGGFGKPHALALLTLLVLAVSWLLERRAAPGRGSALSMVGYTLAFFFHAIPGFTETATRLPSAHPWASGPEDPGLIAAVGAAFVVFLAGAALQLRRFKARR